MKKQYTAEFKAQVVKEILREEKNLASTRSKQERQAMVEPDNKKVSLKAQAHILSLSRSGLYYKPVEPSESEVSLKHKIDEIYTKHPVYGSRRSRD